MVICFIGIGSNLGDRGYNINTAIKKIKALPDTRIKIISGITESLPQGGPPQGPYLNGVIEIETGLSPHRLLQELQRIESFLGRVRAIKNGPRTIDLDILTYGDIRINEEALTIPHPRISERDFVFKPLKEIAPNLFKKLIKEKKGKCKTKKKQFPFEKKWK